MTTGSKKIGERSGVERWRRWPIDLQNSPGPPRNRSEEIGERSIVSYGVEPEGSGFSMIEVREGGSWVASEHRKLSHPREQRDAEEDLRSEVNIPD